MFNNLLSFLLIGGVALFLFIFLFGRGGS